LKLVRFYYILGDMRRALLWVVFAVLVVLDLILLPTAMVSILMGSLLGASSAAPGEQVAL